MTIRVLFGDGDWTLMDGPKGIRWIKAQHIASKGVASAYACWSRIAQVNGKWMTIRG